MLASATSEQQHLLHRPCVNCGLISTRFCDGGEKVPSLNKGQPCMAIARIPKENWLDGQRTPLCHHCDNLDRVCRFCRDIPASTPFAHQDHEVARQTAVFFAAMEMQRSSGKVQRKKKRGASAPSRF